MALDPGNAGTTGEDGREKPDNIASGIQRGDPDVVPVLRRWLAQASDAKTVGEVNTKVVVSLQGLAAYRDTTSVELVSCFYRNAPKGSAVRQIAADALASIGAKQSLPELKGIIWDQQQPLGTRCRAAAALVELDADLGREFLLLQYDLYRLEHKTIDGWNMGPVRDTLERIHDPALVAALKKRFTEEPNDTMRNNISTLVARMEINAQSVENLKDIAADTSWAAGKYRRYAAIEALGRKTGPDSIPFLESLRPWEGIDPNPDHIQQRYVREYASKAIVTIRQRHWEHDTAADRDRDAPCGAPLPHH
jgi:hypothetical protein